MCLIWSWALVVFGPRQSGCGERAPQPAPINSDQHTDKFLIARRPRRKHRESHRNRLSYNHSSPGSSPRTSPTLVSGWNGGAWVVAVPGRTTGMGATKKA